MKIVQSIAFLVHQGLPLRGDGSDYDSNYIQLLNLRAIDDPQINDWLLKKLISIIIILYLLLFKMRYSKLWH